MANSEKRCVITGMGMINAIGNTVEESWNNCINGVSGIKEVKSIDASVMLIWEPNQQNILMLTEAKMQREWTGFPFSV